MADTLANGADVFITEARKLPNLSEIEQMSAVQLTALQKKTQTVRGMYNALPAGAKKQTDVSRWSGYLAEKEAAIADGLVDDAVKFIYDVQDLPNVSAIKQMKRTAFNRTKSAIEAARAAYNALPSADKSKAAVIRWKGYLEDKEAAVGLDFIREARALPNLSAIRSMSRSALNQLEPKLQTARAAYHSLSAVAKNDPEVRLWENYLTQKENERIKSLEETPSEPEEPAEGLIKGNINSRGEKIYHVPGGAYYDRTIIDESAGERWFKTEAEAIAAGWVKSSR